MSLLVVMGRISKSAGALPSWRYAPSASWGVSIRCYCLSPAPQAVPQAAGFSVGLSAAPHAVPQAAGFSVGLSAAPQAVPQAAGLSPAPQAVPQAAGFSAGLSPAPQAVPQAAAGAEASAFLCQPKRLESAMFVTSRMYSAGLSPLCDSYFTRNFSWHKYALFYYSVTFW